MDLTPYKFQIGDEVEILGIEDLAGIVLGSSKYRWKKNGNDMNFYVIKVGQDYYPIDEGRLFAKRSKNG